MNVESVTDVDDERARDYRNLTDVGLRRKLEPEHGIFLAESHQVIARALEAGYSPRSVLTTPRWVEALSVLALPAHVSVLVADEQIVNAITGYRVHRGALAAMERRPLPSLKVVATGPRIAVFENIVDHTNVGAAIRSAAALGVSGVLFTPACADPLYRRSIRVSMGAVFQVPWTRLASWPGNIDLLKSLGYTVVAMTPGEESISLDEFDAGAYSRLALILGTEGAGITPEAQAMADYRVRIPMASGVDSLNVAAAAAVAFYATRP
jgi:tRNA G18 (ribose-2'-O)-methylase SpoU